MTVQFAGVYHDATTEPRRNVPVAMIGGLPIAVIDRIQSAQLMVDVALKRRGAALRPLIFTSANGQVLSMCARQSPVRDLFLDADLIHADGMPLVLVSRLFHKTPLPERVATTDLFHDVARVAPIKRRAHVSARRSQVGDESSRGTHQRTLSPPRSSSATTADTCAGKATKNGSSKPSTRPGRTFSGSASARQLNNHLPCVIATGCAEWD